MDDLDVTQDQNETGSTQAPKRRSRRATRPTMTPDRPTLDVFAELGIAADDDGEPAADAPSEAPAAAPEQVADPATEPAAEVLAAQTPERSPAEDGDDEVDDADEVPAAEPQAAVVEAAEPESDEGDEPEAADDDEDDSMRLPATALLFQAPDLTPRRRRRASAPAGPPEAPEEAEEPEKDDAPAAAPPEAAAEAAPEDADATEDESEGDESGAPRRRRRRGGRGRRRKASGDGETETTEDAAEADAETPDAETSEGDATPSEETEDAPKRKSSKKRKKKSAPEPAEEPEGEAAEEPDTGSEDHSEGGSEGGGSRRRRRRRSRGTRDEGARARDEVTALKGSTRLEAKRQRRRDGRDGSRRRSIITEAEFLARREAVDRAMIVRERGGRTQIAVLEDNVLVEHFVARKTQTSMVGNVYLGRVQNVLPSMEAAFVDLGRGRNAVLYAGEVNWDAAGLDGQPRRIEQALSSGDSVLVQVTKDPIGHKGARLTSQITLAGRYLVLVPSGAMTGISRKLPEPERNRLKKLLKEIVPDGQGVIVRTAAEGASEEELRRDVERLTSAWADIEKKAERPSTSAPVLLKGEPELSTRVVRDVFNEDFRSLTVQGDEAWKTISEYVSAVAPDLAERLHHWTAAEDVFASHRIDEQLTKGLDRKVYLPSGGSLVIDRTEAMTVVDVNTGKFTGSGGTLEETVTRNNLEAAEEIVRQLRLRDIGGIIVIDFIDMVLESNRDLVLRRLVECLGRDRTRHQVAEVTSLGLVQMTRKRVGQGLVEAFSTTCEHCHGRGYHLHDEPVENGAPASDDTEDQPRSGRGGRGRGRRGGGGNGGGQQPAAQAEPTGDPAQRAQVRATLAAIAAAAAHAHDESHDDTDAPAGPPTSEEALSSVHELAAEPDAAVAAGGADESEDAVEPEGDTQPLDAVDDAGDVSEGEPEGSEAPESDADAAPVTDEEAVVVDAATEIVAADDATEPAAEAVTHDGDVPGDQDGEQGEPDLS